VLSQAARTIDPVVELVVCGYGPEAAAALHRALAAAKAGDPLAPVTVVVPSNHVGVATRRLLASGVLGPVAGTGTGLAAVTFVTTYRLAELLGATALAATGRRPVSTPVLTAAMRAQLAARPGLFAPVADHPATESALVATYRELRDLSEGALAALARTSDRAAEAVRLHRAVRSQLAARWYDEEDLLLAAGDAAGAPAAADLGALLVHLPQRLSRHGAVLLAALAEHVPTTVVAARTGVPEADAEVDRSLGRLGLVPPPPAAAALPVDEARTTILTTSDGDEEVRSAVRAVVDAVRRGTRLDRIAVLHATPEPYARLAHEQLQAAGIGTNGAAVLPPAARLAGRTLLDLLALPVAGFRRQDVFAWLSAAPILHRGRWAPTTAWERISRDAKVVGGRRDWDELLERLAAQEEERAARLDQDDDEPEWMAARCRRAATTARELRGFVLRHLDDLVRAAAGPRRWSEHAEWAQARLVDLLGPPTRRDDWPEPERRAAERVERALDRLGALDEVEGPVALDVFSRTLQVELEDDLGRVGRFGDGVLVGSVEMGIGLDLDLVIVLGLAEGTFPSTVRDDSLLPDHERLAAAGELELRADRVERQHRHLLGALAGARRQLLCVPRGDLRRSVDRTPSRWVLDCATQIAGTGQRWWTADLHGADSPWVRHVASFDAGLRALEDPATGQEHRLRALLATDGALTDAEDPRTARGATVIAARRSARFTRFDGNLAGLDIPSPTARPTSPTRLERWAKCPHAHLVEDLLHAAAVENPEDSLVMTALDRGSLVHSALEQFMAEVLQRPEAERPRADSPWTAADVRRLEEIGAALCQEAEDLGLTGRPIFWRRDRQRILDDLCRFLVEDSGWRLRHGTVPVAVELGFGFDELEAVSIRLPDGRTLQVRGRADRLDLAADGTIHVIDYKTGSSRYTAVSEEDPVAGGTKLQLPIYGLAGRLVQGAPDAPVHADYWFVTTKGEWKRIGYEVTEEILQETIATLGTIVEGIEGGLFPHHPSPDASTAILFRIDCDVCDPDGLGVVELRAAWERKRHDPLLSRYADLAEPLDDGGDAAAVPA
jgi:hypothetical protein